MDISQYIGSGGLSVMNGYNLLFMLCVSERHYVVWQLKPVADMDCADAGVLEYARGLWAAVDGGRKLLEDVAGGVSAAVSVVRDGSLWNVFDADISGYSESRIGRLVSGYWGRNDRETYRRYAHGWYYQMACLALSEKKINIV